MALLKPKTLSKTNKQACIQLWSTNLYYIKKTQTKSSFLGKTWSNYESIPWEGDYKTRTTTYPN
jgi:hypothetical protein